MNINHTFQYLQMGLPERINRKKLFGDFEGALQDMEMLSFNAGPPGCHETLSYDRSGDAPASSF